jgi:hypothetical protein
MNKDNLKRRIKAAQIRSGGRYSAGLREEIMRYAEIRKEHGWTFKHVAAELGMNWHTLAGWRKSKHAGKTLRRVKLVTPSALPEKEKDAVSLTIRNQPVQHVVARGGLRHQICARRCAWSESRARSGI